jgi:hypothetical protein
VEKDLGPQKKKKKPPGEPVNQRNNKKNQGFDAAIQADSLPYRNNQGIIS